MTEPRFFSSPPSEALELDLVGFLRWLGSSSVFHLKGRDSSRCRVVMGGLHGNEPSGFHTIYSLLRDPPALAVDAILILGNVPSALFDPPFSRRMVPGEQDMNRVWTREETELEVLVAGIRRYLQELPVEALVDLHNNTGYNPIYAVILGHADQKIALARHWTHRFVHYDGEKLGTFLEFMDDRATGVVIECGQAGDSEANERAYQGTRNFLSAEIPYLPASTEFERSYQSKARITIPVECSLEFSDKRSNSDITVIPDLDRYNFRELPADTRLAFCSEQGSLIVTNSAGQVVTNEFLERRNGELHLTRPVIPVMMTTNAESAKSDCLLYVAEVMPPATERSNGQ